MSDIEDEEYEVQLDCFSSDSEVSDRANNEEDDDQVLAGHIAVRGQEAHMFEPLRQRRDDGDEEEEIQPVVDLYLGRRQIIDCAGPSTSNMETVQGFLQTLTPAGRFSNARTAMCKSYQDLLVQVIQPCCEVYNAVSLPCETAQDEELKNLKILLEECHQKTRNIMPILERDKMKAVVFGCTSSGKSTLINAMMEEDVLPTSMGVCSSCLVQIEGCDEEDSYLALPNGTRGNVKDLEELGSELEAGHLEAGDTAVIYWPKSKCELLNNNILFVDRPGISSDPQVDRVVNNKCDDADVHIFVVDSVASITTESREYFMSVANKLSKPNIFFVFNKWDESAHTKKPEKVRQQHINVAKVLMKEGLNAEVDEEFDRKKIFFVSAREIIWAKTNEKLLLRDHEKRREEFNRFIKELQISISDSAIKTKFGPHCNEGITLCDRLDRLVQATLDCLDHAMNEFHEKNDALIEEVNQLKAKQGRFGDVCENMTEEAKTKLERRVTEKKDNLRRQLDRTLTEIPFEEDEMEVYKEIIIDKFRKNDNKLHDTIEEAITDDLADIRRDMEDLAEIGVGPDHLRLPHATNVTRFMLRRPPTALSDAATRDVRIESPTFTQKMAWYRRGMYSFRAKLTTMTGAALVSTGVGAGLLLIGGSAIGFAKYLEINRQTRKQQILETIMQNYKEWLDEQEHTAQITCLTEAEQLANNIKSTFNEKINNRVDANRNMINTIDRCIQQLKVASECLKIYKNLLKNVKKRFEEFQWNYLQDIHDDCLFV